MISFHRDERIRLIIIAVFVGIGGGLASQLLDKSLELGREILFRYRGEWYFFIFPAIGAIFSSLFLTYVFKDVGGHGVPEVIHSVTKKGGLLRLRSSFSRLVSCAFTIASGGSAGPESPVVISGASIASNIACFFRMKDRQRIALVAGGSAAAIASIFNAPVAGIAFSLEAILGEWTTTNLVTIAVASAIGTEVCRIFQGNQIPFKGGPFVITNLDLIACIGLSFFSFISSLFFMRLLRHIRHVSNMFVSSMVIRSGIGGLLVGAIGMFLPDVLGEGYEPIRNVIYGHYSYGIIISLLLVIGKIIATCFTIGTGGMGGIFAPCLVVGSFLGLFYYKLLIFLFPSIHWAGQAYFSLLGMAGVLSGVIQAPMTGIFLITEITGGYEVLVSVVLVSVISASLVRFFEPFSVYHQELAARGELLRPRTDRRILSELNILELIDRNYYPLRPDMRLREFIEVIKNTDYNFFPVIDPKTKHYIGLIHVDDIRAYLFDPNLYDTILVEELIDPDIPVVSLEDELKDIIDMFDYGRDATLPVVQDRRFIGFIYKSKILDHYRKELIVEEEI